MTPFALVAETVEPRSADKLTLVKLSRKMERAALLDPPPAVVATLQDARFLTPHTRAVYTALAVAGSAATLYARGLPSWVAPGVAGVPLDDDDPLVDEWVVVLPSPKRPAVFAATDEQSPCDPDFERCFRYAVSYDVDVVHACAVALGVDAAVLPPR